MRRNFSKDAWIAILSGVFDCNINSKLDSIDIDVDGLNHADFAFLVKRQWLALEGRYSKKLKLRELGRYIGSNEGVGSVTEHRAVQVLRRARSHFLHKINIMLLRSKIVGFWNLESESGERIRIRRLRAIQEEMEAIQ